MAQVAPSSTSTGNKELEGEPKPPVSSEKESSTAIKQETNSNQGTNATAQASSSKSSGGGWWGTLMGTGKVEEGSERHGESGANAGGWFQGVEKVWEEAGDVVKGVGEKLMATVESVDLEEKSRKLREEGAKLVEGVTEGMKKVEIGKMLDGEKLRGEAERMGREGKIFWGKAGEVVGKKTREMREILLDDGKTKQEAEKKGPEEGESAAPWDEKSLPEKEKAYAGKLREEMGRIVVDAIYSKKKRSDLFLSGASLKSGYKFDFEGNSGMARGALQADGNLRRLRAGLVPRKINEEEFWDNYFYHVDRIRKELVANKGKLMEASKQTEDDLLFGDEDEDEEEVIAPLGEPGPRPKLAPMQEKETEKEGAPSKENKFDSGTKEGQQSSLQDGNNDWDKEIDKIFDDE